MYSNEVLVYVKREAKVSEEDDGYNMSSKVSY